MFLKLSKLFYFFIVSLFCTQLQAQFSDSNTTLINAYFNNTAQTQESILVNNNSFKEFLNEERKNSITFFSYQKGDNNYIDVKSNFPNNQSISQVGNNNNYDFMGFYGVNELNLSVLQLGNENSIQVFGENSIMKNAKIIQKSNLNSIQIYNF